MTRRGRHAAASYCMVALVLGIVLLLGCASPESATGESDLEGLDTIILGGRLIDPDSGLDASRDLGLRKGSVVAVLDPGLGDSANQLRSALVSGGLEIDATSLVIAPGFIDLHAHGQSPESHEFQALDGVTTALELEWGYPRLDAWFKAKRGTARVHYGASVSHGMLRSLAMSELDASHADIARDLEVAAGAPDPLRAFQGGVSASFYRSLSEQDWPVLVELLNGGLEEGGIGFGMAHQYYPGATRGEIYRVFELAAEHQAPIFTHVRNMGFGGVQEVLANACASGAPLHIVHLNSSSLQELPKTLELVRGASARCPGVTAETYPYTAGSTALQSALFDEGWQERLGGITFSDIQWQDTGERLTAETFATYREQGGTVIIHMMQDEIVDLAVADPDIIIASDGMPYAPGAHPRSAGTFSRVLGRYVRERGVLDLQTAIRKMTLLPAQRLERIAPAMKKKGRIREGADADIVIFDAKTILDTANFEKDLSPSVGMHWVLVAGVALVSDGELVPDAFPGQPVLGRLGQPGVR